MELFKNETQEALEKFVSKDWSEILSQYISVEQIEKIKNTIKNERLKEIVYPDSKDVFKAFQEPYMNIKVVIVGQDPYFNGNADGLAFSCKNNLSPSLRQILISIFNNKFREFTRSGWGKYLETKNNWNLEYLAKQGVFLYNPSLTVREKSPGSHEYIWKDFNKAVIQSLYNRESLVWMIWGSKAKEAVNLKDSKHLYLYNEHPASAARNNRIWKCDHFSKCNNYLKERNMEEIEWLL